MLQAGDFRRRFFNLILLTWTIPPVFGLLFIVFIRILSPKQLLGILFTPLEPVYIVGWLLFALWYYPRYVRPIQTWLDDPAKVPVSTVLQIMRRFPLHYWGIFLVYLLLAPASVIISAELFTDYIAQPVDWFRIHLVALIVAVFSLTDRPQSLFARSESPDAQYECLPTFSRQPVQSLFGKYLHDKTLF